MNAKRAKWLRKQLYGKSWGAERLYLRDPKTGAVVASGMRRQYQDVKRTIAKNPQTFSAIKHILLQRGAHTNG